MSAPDARAATRTASLAVLLAALFATSSAAAAPDPPPAWWVRLDTPADFAAARSAGLSFAESNDGDWYLVLGERSAVEASGLAFRPDTRAAAADDDAPTPDDVDAHLSALADEGAGELVQIGESVLGRPIFALRIGDGPRALRVVGGTHGDETNSVVVALAVADALAHGGAPPDTEIWVVPSINPDGLAAGTRANADGVDLNRNFGVAWDPDQYGAGEAPFSEPETRALRSLARTRDFAGGLALHSGAQNIGWVWNWTRDQRPPEEQLFAAIAADYAEVCTAPGFWTTNGADWYLTPGEATDWTYGEWGAQDFTVEVSLDKSATDSVVEWHLDAILAFLDRPADRVADVVDATTGDPVPARIDGQGAGTARTGPDGTYARWASDTLPLVASAPGYRTAPLADRTELVPDALVALPSRLLSRGAGPATLSFPGIAGDLTLEAPGETDVPVQDGTVDPADLAPGAWTVVSDAGAAPRSLFVGEVDDRVVITSATLDGDALTLTGRGFGVGSEAWSLGGTGRAPRRLANVSDSVTSLAFALEDDDAADVLVWSAGAWLSVLDVRGDPTFDRTPPSATADIGPLAVQGACGTAAPPRGTGILLALAAVACARRSTAARGACGLPSARG